MKAELGQEWTLLKSPLITLKVGAQTIALRKLIQGNNRKWQHTSPSLHHGYTEKHIINWKAAQCTCNHTYLTKAGELLHPSCHCSCGNCRLTSFLQDFTWTLNRNTQDIRSDACEYLLWHHLTNLIQTMTPGCHIWKSAWFASTLNCHAAHNAPYSDIPGRKQQY